MIKPSATNEPRQDAKKVFMKFMASFFEGQNYSFETGNKTLHYLSADMAKNQVFIALGTNLGDRIQNVRKAVLAIEANLGEIIKQSSLYETKPWGKSDQPDFLNQVILVITDKIPQECLNALSSIERQFGRNRDVKWGARIIDLDLLYVNDQIINTEKLILPHPGIPQRRFVLVPMAEIAPDFIHPQLLKKQKQLLEECADTLEVKLLQT